MTISHEPQILVPVAEDGSWFHPQDGSKNGFRIGEKGSERTASSYWQALQQLRAMRKPKWRRPSTTSGTPGIVTGIRWVPQRLVEIESAIAANRKLPPQGPCPVALLVERELVDGVVTKNESTHGPPDSRTLKPLIFDPRIANTARKTRIAEIRVRQGQPEFRSQLLQVYCGRCAITGCDVPEALEAAHIVPYGGTQSNDLRNGLLLRADIHTLFDLRLIDVDEANWIILIADSLMKSEYRHLHKTSLCLPPEPNFRPAPEAFRFRRTVPIERTTNPQVTTPGEGRN